MALAHAVEATNDLAAARGEWTRLALPGGNVFSTWEWADCWRRHIGPDGELSIGWLRDGAGATVALLPFHLGARFGLPVARLVGFGPADQLGPVCAPGEAPAAAAALLRHGRRAVGGAGVVVAERLPGEAALPGTMGVPVLRREPSPSLVLEGSFEDYLASRSRNFRSQARRHERRLEREHGLRYRLTEDPEQLSGDFETLLALHAARWGEHSAAFAGPRGAFHRDFAARALEAGWLRLWTMELDGRPVAAWYGLRFGRVETYYQAGRDPRYEELHVGFVLLAHTIRAACEDGMREYRFGLGGEEYKFRFTELDAGLDTVAVGVGLPGRAAVAWVRASLRVPPERRARVRGLVRAVRR